MGCPACEGRTGPETVLESLCQKHFDELEGPSREAMREAMERGRKAAEAARAANKASRCNCFGSRKSK